MKILKGLLTGEYPNTDRTEALTDGIFAIVMTLLVLELAAPEVHGATGVSGLSDALREMWPKFYAYVLSFLVLGMYWTRHHLLFERIARTNALLVWLNILFLMTVSLIPLSTSLLGDYREIRLAVVFYGINLLVNNFLLAAVWWYAVGKSLLDEKVTQRAVKKIKLRLVITLLLILVGVIVGIFGRRLSLYIFSAVILMMIISPLLLSLEKRAQPKKTE